MIRIFPVSLRENNFCCQYASLGRHSDKYLCHPLPFQAPCAGVINMDVGALCTGPEDVCCKCVCKFVYLLSYIAISVISAMVLVTISQLNCNQLNSTMYTSEHCVFFPFCSDVYCTHPLSCLLGRYGLLSRDVLLKGDHHCGMRQGVIFKDCWRRMKGKPHLKHSLLTKHNTCSYCTFGTSSILGFRGRLWKLIPVDEDPLIQAGYQSCYTTLCY